MRDLPWRRKLLIGKVRRDVWRYLTPASNIEAAVLEAAALLQMPAAEVRAIGALQFLTSTELGSMLDEIPSLLRRLATTTTQEEEWSAERIRGSIQWGRTIGARYATGMPHMYVTAPSRRAFQTPENELLVFLLDQVAVLGRRSGWHSSSSPLVGDMISDRVGRAEQFRHVRMLENVERSPVTPRGLSRIRSGRFRRRYGAVLAAYGCYEALAGRLDRESVRRAVEAHGLVSRDDPTLFELYCTFEILKAIEDFGWKMGRLGLFAGSLVIRGVRGSEAIEVTYQGVPQTLSRRSRYSEVQRAHGIDPGALRPDLTIRRRQRDGRERWLLVEAKGGERGVQKSARAAIYDLLAYRATFAAILTNNPRPYGLGVVWGAGLRPATSEAIYVCTPENVCEGLAPIAA